MSEVALIARVLEGRDAITRMYLEWKVQLMRVSTQAKT